MHERCGAHGQMWPPGHKVAGVSVADATQNYGGRDWNCCPVVPAPSNGAVALSPDDRTATFTCKSGMVMTGPTTATCTGAAWSAAPTCAATCAAGQIALDGHCVGMRLLGDRDPLTDGMRIAIRTKYIATASDAYAYVRFLAVDPASGGFVVSPADRLSPTAVFTVRTTPGYGQPWFALQASNGKWVTRTTTSTPTLVATHANQDDADLFGRQRNGQLLGIVTYTWGQRAAALTRYRSHDPPDLISLGPVTRGPLDEPVVRDVPIVWWLDFVSAQVETFAISP